jgi:hypothetical protein
VALGEPELGLVNGALHHLGTALRAGGGGPKVWPGGRLPVGAATAQCRAC